MPSLFMIKPALDFLVKWRARITESMLTDIMGDDGAPQFKKLVGPRGWDILSWYSELPDDLQAALATHLQTEFDKEGNDEG